MGKGKFDAPAREKASRVKIYFRKPNSEPLVFLCPKGDAAERNLRGLSQGFEQHRSSLKPASK